MTSQYLRHIRRRLLQRAALHISAAGPGAVLLIAGSDVADRTHALEAVLTRLGTQNQHRVALFPWSRDEPSALAALLPAPLADTLIVVDGLQYADEPSLRQLISAARHPDSTVSVIATVEGSSLDHLATDVIRLPPLTLAETAGYLHVITGRHIPLARVEEVHDSTGGWPGAIKALVSTMPEGMLWRAIDAPTDAAHLRRAQELAMAGELPTAELHLNECSPDYEPAEQNSLRGYLALNRGLRHRAHEYLADPGDDARSVLLSLADWDLRGMQEKIERIDASASTEASILGLVADAALSGRMPPLDIQPDTEINRQRLAMVHGWLALTFDDPLTARERLQHRPGQSTITGVWQDAWLSRTLYVLGEWSTAARVVERGLASSEAHGMELLEPLLLWTGVQIAAMQGDNLLARNHLQRLTLSEDAFLIQSLPASMGRMIVAANSSDLPAALRTGALLARTVSSTDTQHPGFWPWEDVYAQTLIRAGRIEAADELITATEDRHSPSGLISLMAKNAVPRATIQLQRGEVTAGLRTFEQAVEAILDTPMPAYQSRILFEYGKVLRRHGRRQRADEILSHAGEIFAQMDATVMVERCAAERRVGGVGLVHHTNPHGLTPQEQQIAALVAEGATNAAVARELSLSTKTVEYHLTRVYRKIGIRTRQELRVELAGRR